MKASEDEDLEDAGRQLGDVGQVCQLVSRPADGMEDEQIERGEQVWAGSRAVPAGRAAGERAVRFALTRATESLGDVLRIAHSRGLRAQGKSPENAAQN